MTFKDSEHHRIRTSPADTMLDLISDIVANANQLKNFVTQGSKINLKNDFNVISDPKHFTTQPRTLLTKARNILKIRRYREQMFGIKGLFSDPSWDILLDLFIAHLTDKKIAVTSACIAAQVAPTTALRWITVLEQHGLLDRENDPTDARRAFISLNAVTIVKMTHILDSCTVEWGEQKYKNI